MSEFNLIKFQDDYIAAFINIETNGVGKHRKRSRWSLQCKAYEKLKKVGYSPEQTKTIIKDVIEVAKLQLACEED